MPNPTPQMKHEANANRIKCTLGKSAMACVCICVCMCVYVHVHVCKIRLKHMCDLKFEKHQGHSPGKIYLPQSASRLPEIASLEKHIGG